MKTLLIVAVLGSNYPIIPLFAQPDCNCIYLTAHDFILGKYYPVCATRGSSKNAYYYLLANNHFFIADPGYAWRRIDKENVFAIKSCEGDLIRIYQGTNYYLLNPGEKIPLYKAVIFPSSKGAAIRVKYCFSRDLVSEIRELTIENLKITFQDDPSFCEAINEHFSFDSELFEYNQINKGFEINRVYNTCKQPNL